ncbi:MAG: tetratricopeptide repeat protein [Bacteroidales bacterium]|jgi:tetratricopeptide (TPR) repeat protein|nr:tetratricopeptide repeat protein [Bacteroidales bacterium]
MEFLKRSISGIVMILIVLGVSAQNQPLRDAFSKSYTFEKEGKYGDAIKALLPLYAANSYEMNLRLGWLSYKNSSHDQSITYYKKAITLMPVATEPLWGIIYPYSAQEKWNNVEQTYKQILKLDPKNGLAHYRLGLINYYRKKYPEAKKYFDVALNQTPFNYDYMLMSAWNNYFLGKYSEAKVLFNKVLLYNPDDKSALEGISLIK